MAKKREKKSQGKKESHGVQKSNREERSKGKRKVRRDKKTGRFVSASVDEAPPEADADSPTEDAEGEPPNEGEEASPRADVSEEPETDQASEDDEREDDDEGDSTRAEPEDDEEEEPGDRASERDDEEGEEDEADELTAAEVDPDKEAHQVAAVIDLDEELDADPEARAELIAAAAGLTDDLPAQDEDDAEEGGDSSGTPEDDGEASPSEDDDEAVEGATDDDIGPDSEDDAAAPDEEPADEGEDDPESEEDGSEEEGGTPIIGRDALVALHEFREEGVATMPEERVLELGETVAPEERDRLLAAALAHVQMQDAIYRVPTESGTARRWKGLIAASVLVMALFIAGLPPAFLVPEGPTELSAEDRLRGVRVSLLVQAEQIEAFRVRQDRLPESLAEVRTALPGIRFIKSNDRLYQLIAYLPDGEPLVYDSASPDAVFSDVASSWVTTRDHS